MQAKDSRRDAADKKRVLVTWGSKRGGTAGIGRVIGETLERRGFEVTAASVEDVKGLDGFDAVIVGGALYANRWTRSARRFVSRRVEELRRRPVWLFSSGPLDDSADDRSIPPTRQVAVLAERIGAIGHVTFGGRLEPNARGFPASAMAREKSGDWRNPERVRAWAEALADGLPEARPGVPVVHPARSLPRLIAHAVVGWALCGAVMAGLLGATTATTAELVHAVAVPVIFGALAWHYFGERGAREPLATALCWTAVVVGLDLVVVAWLIQGSFAMFASVLGVWLPVLLIFLVTWGVGALVDVIAAPAGRPEFGHARA